MSKRAFQRLAPFIREYIFAQGWTELREIQVQAIQAILDTDDHLLLASGTASGKTEAAFLPILTLLEQTPSTSLGVLYIGPTKALINDQWQRLQYLLAAANFPVWSWHGDVAQNRKEQLLRAPRGVLQITPESLESLLINRNNYLEALFHDLRFVIIDEVHVFMGSERGQQILCQLARLRRYSQSEPRRIGLSATLGDYALAKSWLAAGSSRSVLVPPKPKGGQRLRLSLEHFVRSINSTLVPAEDPFYHYLFEQTRGRKCLIFTNRRAETEDIIAALRQIAAASGYPDIYHVHHGSVAPALREAAEAAMRDPYRPAVTAATVTLELGIDLGQLEGVVQLDAPHSVMSFLQRLGRSGRRGGPREMRLVTTESDTDRGGGLPLPWQLLQSIAILELYLQKQWIEPVEPPRYPFSLLYQQTLSTLLAAGELQPAALAQRVLTLPPFQHISTDDYRLLLRHLLAIDHLERIENGSLIVGLAGEKVARNWRFFAVFQDSDEYTVYDASREIGTISSAPAPGELLALAGSTWEVQAVDTSRKQVLVTPAPGRATIAWSGTSVAIHDRILQEMRRILVASNTEYRYLRPGASQRLQQARTWARAHRLDHHMVIPWGRQNTFCILPWRGSRGFRRLERVLRFLGSAQLGITSLTGYAPYYFIVQTEIGSANVLEQGIADLIQELASPEQLLAPGEVPRMQKYDEFVPDVLLRKAYIYDQL